MNVKQLNILLADDDKDDCTFFKKALDELQISAHLSIVHDGDKLMQRLTDETRELPHILFLDLNMPRKTGFDCLYDIKHNETLKDLPVVIFSTSGSHEKINMLFKSGAHVYIRKPGDFSQLKQVIHHALPIAMEEVSVKSKVKYILNA